MNDNDFVQKLKHTKCSDNIHLIEKQVLYLKNKQYYNFVDHISFNASVIPKEAQFKLDGYYFDMLIKYFFKSEQIFRKILAKYVSQLTKDNIDDNLLELFKHIMVDCNKTIKKWIDRDDNRQIDSNKYLDIYILYNMIFDI